MLGLRVLVVNNLITENGLSVCGGAGLGGGHAGSVELSGRGLGEVASTRNAAGSSVRGLCGSRLSGGGSRVIGVLSRDRSLVSGDGSVLRGLVGKVAGSIGDVLLLDFSLGLVLGGVQVGRVGGVSLAGTVLGLTDEFLSLCGEIVGGVLGELGGVRSLLSSDVADLLCLLVDEGAGVVELGVNDLAVVDVDQGHSVDDGSSEKSKSPLGHDLDKEVRDESSEEGLHDSSV